MNQPDEIFELDLACSRFESAWLESTEATQALMVEFYRNLFQRKLSKLESLRQAQLWLLNNRDATEGRDLSTRGKVRPTKAVSETETPAERTGDIRTLPAYWAAFQLSGDPR